MATGRLIRPRTQEGWENLDPLTKPQGLLRLRRTPLVDKIQTVVIGRPDYLQIGSQGVFTVHNGAVFDGVSVNNLSSTSYFRNASGIASYAANASVAALFVYRNGSRDGTNGGILRDGATSSGNQFFISQGSKGDRPWIRWNATSILDASSGDPLPSSGAVLFRVYDAAWCDVWWSGVQKHYASHIRSAGAHTYYNIGYQSNTSNRWRAKWDLVVFFHGNQLPDEAECRALTLEPFRTLFEPANETPFLYVVGAGATEITTTVGSVVVTGVNAVIAKHKAIATTVGSVDVTGVNAVISTSNNVEIATTVGSVQIAGVNASLNKGVAVSASVGSVTVTGVNATIDTSTNVEVSVSVGSVQVAGVNAVIEIAGLTQIITTVGAVTVTGTDAVINKILPISVSVGSIDVTGINATISKQKAVSAAVGSVEVSGVSATIVTPTVIVTGAGTVVVTGYDAVISGLLWTEVSAASTTWTPISDASTTWTEI